MQVGKARGVLRSDPEQGTHQDCPCQVGTEGRDGTDVSRWRPGSPGTRAGSPSRGSPSLRSNTTAGADPAMEEFLTVLMYK